MKRLRLEIRIFLVRVAFAFGRRLPLRRRVVLATAHAAHLGGNLAMIADDLRANHPTVDVVTLTHRPGAGLRGLLGSVWPEMLAGYHLARARIFIVDDYYFPMYVMEPRRETTFVQTWHASGAFKKVGYSVLGKSFGADQALVRRLPIHRYYDVCLVASMRSATHYAEAFDQPLERFRSDLGLPRTDVLFGEERISRTVAAVRERYGLADGRRVVLYAPTFRGDTVHDAHSPADLDLTRMRDGLGADHVLLVRLHPFVRAAAPIGPELAGFAIDVSDHPDINELLLVSDVLITDYSSVIYEFSLLGRPMVFFAPDFEAYERERGFYFDYRSGVPGPIAESTDEVIAILREERFDPARVAAFRAASFDVADGRATPRFIEALVLPALAR